MTKIDNLYHLGLHEFGAINPSLEILAIIRDQVEEMKENVVSLDNQTPNYFRGNSKTTKYR